LPLINALTCLRRVRQMDHLLEPTALANFEQLQRFLLG
jgi:hypothetical protein